MISYGKVKQGVYAHGDPAVVAIVSHFLASNKSQYSEVVGQHGVFCSPDPRKWLIQSVSQYLDSASTLESAKVVDPHDQPKIKSKR